MVQIIEARGLGGTGDGGGGPPTRQTFNLTNFGSNEIVVPGLQSSSRVTVTMTDADVVSGAWRPSIQVSNSGTTWLDTTGNYVWVRFKDGFEQFSSNDRIFGGDANSGEQFLVFNLFDANDTAGDQTFRLMIASETQGDVYVMEGVISGSTGPIEQLRIFNQQGASNFNAGECIVRLKP